MDVDIYKRYNSGMTVDEVRSKYLKFFKAKPRNHVKIKPAPLVLEDDPTTLFTSSGMQPLVPYLLGEKHPKGKRLVNSQPAIRLQDIEEVGDFSHTTFFEMLGNWSLGDYFKDEQLAWFWEFMTKELNLPKGRLWVSVFEGNDTVPRDEQSAEIWKKLGVPKGKIMYYGVKNNWWSRVGTPKQMPVGDIGGPDSEVFFEFPRVKHDERFGKECHSNCDCGRFLEIGNSVFVQYKKVGENKLEELPNKNVDFGGGLERLTAATIDSPDVFDIDVFWDAIGVIEKHTKKPYKEEGNKPSMRIIADHLRAASFLLAGGVEPGNKLQGYVARRLIRRAVFRLRLLGFDIGDGAISTFIKSYAEDYDVIKNNWHKIKDSLNIEAVKFGKALNRGLRKLEKSISNNTKIDGKFVFDLYQTEGFPLELTLEILEQKGVKFSEKDKKDFEKEFEGHRKSSRSAASGMFKGGLVDHSGEVKRLHTATHLLQAALRKVLGDHVEQKGQNIVKERSRFDFSHEKKLTEEELKEVEDLINKIVKENLPVKNKMLPKSDAEKSGALHFFGEKYGDEISVYFVGKDLKSAFSKEYCGGPHVKSTGEIGRVRIKKQEKIGAGVVRIYLEKEE